MIGVPHLEFEPRRYFALGFVPREQRFLFRYNNLFLRHQIVEREHKSPVEITLARQRPVMYVRTLAVFRAFQPPVNDKTRAKSYYNINGFHTVAASALERTV